MAFVANVTSLGFLHVSAAINAREMNNVNARAVFEYPLSAGNKELSNGDMFL